MNTAGDILQQVAALTAQVVQTLDAVSFEELEEFVEQRESLLAEFHAELLPAGDRDQFKEQIHQILEHDQLISAKMLAFKQEAQRGIQKFQAAEKYKQTYDKEYTIDSIFFNRTK
jgi:hypothetical protein